MRFVVEGVAAEATWSQRLAREPRMFVPASAAWGFAEATLFFVIPDVVVGWVALHDWKKGLVAAVAAVTGALVGGMLVFAFPGAFLPLFPALPAITPRMVDEVGASVDASGAFAMLAGPFGGIPYKIFAAQSGALGVDALLFAVLTPIARLERIAPIALLLSAIGYATRRVRAERPPLVLPAYAGGWLLQYVVYYALIFAKYGSL